MKEEFLKKVYQFYPKNIKSGTDDYKLSPEFINLNDLINNANEEKQLNRILYLKNFLLNFVDKKTSFQDYTLFVSGDRCYNIQLVKDMFEQQKSHSICINMSLLIPYYTIHVIEISRSKDYKRRIGNPKRRADLEQTLYKTIIASIHEFIKTKLNLNLFPTELLFDIIPDVSYQNAEFGKFNFYNAFF